jgi:hypothetical protein
MRPFADDVGVEARTAAQLATIWPHGVSAVDFGVGPDLTNGTGRDRSRRRQA